MGKTAEAQMGGKPREEEDVDSTRGLWEGHLRLVWGARQEGLFCHSLQQRA